LRDIWIKITQTGGARFYGILIGIVSLSITARALGPDGRGELAAANTWVETVKTVVYLSLGQVAFHHAASNRDSDWLPSTLSSLVWFTALLTLTGWLVVAGLYFGPTSGVFGGITALSLVLAFLLLPLGIWEQYSQSLLMAIDKLDVYNRYTVIGRTVSFLCVMGLFVGATLEVWGVLVASLIGQAVVSSGGAFLLFRRSGGIRRPEFRMMLTLLKGGVKLHLNAIGGMLILASDVLFINYYRGTEEAGFYQLGTQLVGLMLILPTAASMVIYTRIGDLGIDAAWAVHRRIMMQTLGVMIVGAVLAWLTVPYWLVWIAGPAFTPTIDLFRWQVLAVLGMSLSILMAPQWISRGYFVAASAVTLAVGLSNLVANYLMVPVHGAYGAIWASIGTYGIAIAANIGMILRCDRRKHDTK